MLSSWKIISLNLSELAVVTLDQNTLQQDNNDGALPKGIIERYISRNEELRTALYNNEYMHRIRDEGVQLFGLVGLFPATSEQVP